jgi:hypothetical protein
MRELRKESSGFFVRIRQGYLAHPLPMHAESIETCKSVLSPIILYPKHDDSKIDTEITNILGYWEALNIAGRVYIVREIRNADVLWNLG